MLAGALVFVAPFAWTAPASGALPLPGSPACPIDIIPFAPPLDTPLMLTRSIARSLADGMFTQTVTYAVSFTRSGRGYRMRWQQTGQQSEGPPELLRLLALEADSARGETLDFTLDANGRLLGVTEAPDAAERLAAAIGRLRSDPALTRHAPREQALIGQMLDRIATLPAAERADLHLTKASRLAAVAGQRCGGHSITGQNGTAYRVTHAADPGGEMVLVSSAHDRRGDGSTVAIDTEMTISAQTGLALMHRQSTVTEVAGTRRTNTEVMQLQAVPAAPQS